MRPIYVVMISGSLYTWYPITRATLSEQTNNRRCTLLNKLSVRSLEQRLAAALSRANSLNSDGGASGSHSHPHLRHQVVRSWDVSLRHRHHHFHPQRRPVHHETSLSILRHYNHIYPTAQCAVWAVCLPRNRTSWDIYLKICVLIYHLTYICPSLFDCEVNTFFFIFVNFKLHTTFD